MRDVIAFARFAEGHWTEQPVLVFTHLRGLSKDPYHRVLADAFWAKILGFSTSIRATQGRNRLRDL
jgi:hypothetical protein